MIAPIRPIEREARRRKDRRGIEKARRWIARSMFPRAEKVCVSTVSSRAAWTAAGWMLFVAVAYFGYYFVERFGRD